MSEYSEAAKHHRRKVRKAYREKNKERIQKYDRAWRKKNPDKQADINRRYWERKMLKEGDSVESKVYRLHRAGESLRAIAKELDISHMKVKRILDQYSEYL